MHHAPQPGFLQLEDLIGDQGDIPLIIKTNSMSPNTPKILSFSCLPPLPSQKDIALCYFEASHINPCTTTFQLANECNKHSLSCPTQLSSPADTPPLTTLVVKKKYRPVALKTHPVLGTLPSKFHIECNIIRDPLTDILIPPLILLPFALWNHYTNEWCNKMDNLHPPGFLWPIECDLLHHFMALQNEGFALDDSEHGHFCEDFFPPIKIPVIMHMPWVEQNILIPPGIYDKVCKIICMKMDASTYEHSNSSYHSHWFCIAKKEAEALRPVHSLKPLNGITIQHSSVTPFTEQIAEQFAGCACGGMLNLYIGYNEHALTETSCNYTMIQTLYGTLCLTKLPMGWTNAVSIFHNDVTHILQPDVPQYTIPYIDDVPIFGPTTMYQAPNSTFKTILENSSICHFVWEHFQNLNHIVQQMKYCGGTFSGKKSLLCMWEITVVGHVCTLEGCITDPSRVDKIVNWGPFKDLSKVQAFLSTIGIVRVFIQDFAHLTHPLMLLTCKDTPFIFGPKQISVQETLKAVLLVSPALQPINYTSDVPVILAINTSQIAIGFLLCQCNTNDPCIHHYVHFGSITLNDCESWFLQLKLELYGLFHALCSLKAYPIRVINLVVEVDARYIKGMLVNSDLAPSASINHWIISILLFHFTLIHIPGTRHGPNRLSWWPKQPANENDEPMEDLEFNNLVDQVYGFMHFLKPLKQMVPGPEPSASYASEAINDNGITNNPTSKTLLTYNSFPQSNKSWRADNHLCHICNWFVTTEHPPGLTNVTYTAFLCYTKCFFQKDGHLWRKGPQGHHKVVINCDKWPAILTAGHHGDFAACTHIIDHFWWPHLSANIAWFIRTCHICQLHQTHNILIPPVVTTPVPLFSKMYMDTMHFLKSGGFKYFIQGHFSLAHFPKYHSLHTETMKTIGD